MPHVEKLADLLVLLFPIFPLTSPGTIQGGLAAQYWSWRSSDATTLQMMQFSGMIAVGVSVSAVDAKRSRGSLSSRIDL
jgi:hypothetical protein